MVMVDLPIKLERKKIFLLTSQFTELGRLRMCKVTGPFIGLTCLLANSTSNIRLLALSISSGEMLVMLEMLDMLGKRNVSYVRN